MKRVLVLGSGGAGKSTFSGRLGDALQIPVIHLDRHYWWPNWVETPKDEWTRIVGDLLSGDSWVMDGNYGGTVEMRIVPATPLSCWIFRVEFVFTVS